MPDLSRPLSPESVSRAPAVCLFVERARAIAPKFTLTTDNAGSVAEICVRLEGVPLAIELCAPWVKIMPPQEIVMHLDDQLALLTGGFRNVPARHRTLRAAIASSYNLLPEAQQVLLRRLSVFTGGWTLDAAQHVCEEDGLDVLSALASLVDKSLVRRTGDGDPGARFDLLESMRQFARGQLEARGAALRVLQRHTEHFAAIAEKAEAAIGAAPYGSVVLRLARDYENLRSALQWALDQREADAALRLAGGLGWYWHTLGDLASARPLMERALAADQAPSAARGAALIAAGAIACGQGDYETAVTWLEEAVILNRRLGRNHHAARALAFLGHTARSGGEYSRAITFHNEALATYRQLSSEWGIAWSIYDLGLVARDRGNRSQARSHFEESLTRFEVMHYEWATAWTRWNLGVVAAHGAADAEAANLYGESLLQFWKLEDRRGVAQSLEGLAVLFARRDRDIEAATLLGAGESLRIALGVPPDPSLRQDVATASQRARERLGHLRFRQALGEGRTKALEDTIDLALLLQAQRDATGTAPPREGPPREGPRLSAREQQVAALIAQGYSNREVGVALAITERTAITHVEHIMNKLGVNSRAQIAAWAVRHGVDRPG
jgi:non-specific serine/threonine protein kinase